MASNRILKSPREHVVESEGLSMPMEFIRHESHAPEHKDRMREFIECIFEVMHHDLECLKRAISKAEWDDIVNWSHRFVGTALLLHDEVMERWARYIETAALARDFECGVRYGLPGLEAAVKGQLEDIKAQLDRIQNELSGETS